jgi:hypothetical protein
MNPASGRRRARAAATRKVAGHAGRRADHQPRPVPAPSHAASRPRQSPLNVGRNHTERHAGTTAPNHGRTRWRRRSEQSGMAGSAEPRWGCRAYHSGGHLLARCAHAQPRRLRAGLRRGRHHRGCGGAAVRRLGLREPARHQQRRPRAVPRQAGLQVPATRPLRWERASTMTHVRPHAPPFFMLHGSNDSLAPGSKRTPSSTRSGGRHRDPSSTPSCPVPSPRSR